MEHKTKQPLKNQLALFRQRKSLEQKQVAALLGHKGTEQLSRYENGVKVPHLKTALKLAQIYGIPIRILLDGYFEACREEIRRQDRHSSNEQNAADSKSGDKAVETDICTIEENLLSPNVRDVYLDKARRHAADLIRMRGEKLNHI